MVEKREVLIGVCDQCGDIYDGYGEGGYTVYDHESGVWDAVEPGGWIVERELNGRMFCSRGCESNYNPPKSKDESQSTDAQQPHTAICPVTAMQCDHAEIVVKCKSAPGTCGYQDKQQ